MTQKLTQTDERARPKQKKRKDERPVKTDKEYRLFWKNELASWPRIAIPYTDSNGVTQFYQEHMPDIYGGFSEWMHRRYLWLRVKLNLPIYYWHVRFAHTPYTRKRYDLMFAAHVICDHDGVPTDKAELRHYQWLRFKYGAELDYFTPVFEVQKEGKHTYWDGYAQSYVDMWIRRPYPELIMLFHGLDVLNYVDYKAYEERDLQKELKKVLAQYAARRRWSKAKSRQTPDN